MCAREKCLAQEETHSGYYIFMKNFIKTLSLLTLLIPSTIWAKDNVICSFDERETESTFFCMNRETKKPTDYTVPSIVHKSVFEDLQE